MITVTNDTFVTERSVSLSSNSEVRKQAENDSQVRARTHIFFNPHDVIGIELSFVPHVEYVFVDRESDLLAFRVTTIVNNSTPQTRNQIYDREIEIAEQLPHADIEFRIFDLRGRKVSEIMTDGGKLVFRRR